MPGLCVDHGVVQVTRPPTEFVIQVRTSKVMFPTRAHDREQPPVLGWNPASNSEGRGDVSPVRVNLIKVLPLWTPYSSAHHLRHLRFSTDSSSLIIGTNRFVLLIYIAIHCGIQNYPSHHLLLYLLLSCTTSRSTSTLGPSPVSTALQPANLPQTGN